MGLVTEAIKNLFRKPSTEEQSKEKDWFIRGKLSIDISKCTGCSLCEKVCPSKAIKMVEDNRTKLKKSPIINISECIFCGFCVDYCPTEALSFTRSCALTSYEKESYVRG
jgi:NADH-quinone oxidoreductase subunit I